MGRVFVEYIPIGPESNREIEGTIYDNDFDEDVDEDFSPFIMVCRCCRTHLTKGTELVSKDFTGRSGRAFLFNSVINTMSGTEEDRMLRTGMHTIADIYCNGCSKPLGWRYIHAFDERQRYKIGRVILEAAYISKMENARPRLLQTQMSISSDSSSSSSAES